MWPTRIQRILSSVYIAGAATSFTVSLVDNGTAELRRFQVNKGHGFYKYRDWQDPPKTDWQAVQDGMWRGSSPEGMFGEGIIWGIVTSAVWPLRLPLTLVTAGVLLTYKEQVPVKRRRTDSEAHRVKLLMHNIA